MSGIVEEVHDTLIVESDSIPEDFLFQLPVLYVLYILKFISYKKVKINRV